MHRFYLPPAECEGAEWRLTGAEAAHATRVLRLRAGDRVIVLDGAGGEYAVRLAAVERREVRLAVETRRRHPRPAVEVALFAALTKTRSFELILQKATELGATEIVPVVTARSVPAVTGAEAARKQAKWRAIAVEALKQCGTPWLPAVHPPRPFAAAIAAPPPELALLADLSPDCRPLGAALDEAASQRGRFPARVALWIGPEGDFTPEEIAALRAAGALPVSLGPRVLRSETAVFYGLAVIADRWAASRE